MRFFENPFKTKSKTQDQDVNPLRIKFNQSINNMRILKIKVK